LAFYAERRLKPRRLDDATRLTLVVIARFAAINCCRRARFSSTNS
jgi:hypothetical protein